MNDKYLMNNNRLVKNGRNAEVTLKHRCFAIA
jgi:hypothetical protein